MIVIQDSTLQQVGIDYAEAVALLQPSEGELVIHIADALPAPPEPPILDTKAAPPEPHTRVSSLVDATDQQSAGLPGDTIQPAPIGTPEPTPFHPPRLLPDSGWSVHDVAAAALKVYSTIAVDEAGRVTLSSAFGSKTYDSLADVVKAINTRTF